MRANLENCNELYRVRLGLNEVTVNGNSVMDAITQARRQLALELPRFYDVISKLEANRFEVRPAA